MPNTRLTLPKIRKKVRTRLGVTGVSVELEDEDIDEVVEDVIGEYGRTRPLQMWKALSVSPEVQKYDITEPGILGVINVQIILRGREVDDLSELDPFQLQLHTGLGVSGLTAGEFSQALSYREDQQRVFSTRPDWRSQWEGDKLFLYVSVPLTPDKVSYQYTRHFTADDNADTGMHLVPEDDVDLINGLILAGCKEILGRKRSKFGGVVGPGGGVERTDGETLIQEAKDEKRELMERLETRIRPIPPHIG